MLKTSLYVQNNQTFNGKQFQLVNIFEKNNIINKNCANVVGQNDRMSTTFN